MRYAPRRDPELRQKRSWLWLIKSADEILGNHESAISISTSNTLAAGRAAGDAGPPAIMENAINTCPSSLDLKVIDVTTMDHSKRLELLARWIPVCQEIAEEHDVELPCPDRLRLMILSAYETMCLLAHSALAFPDPIMQDRVMTQFLIDCFTAGQKV
jgi:hypothetical protein